MLSCDTNILVAAVNSAAPDHVACHRFLTEQLTNKEFVLSEFVLVETYNLVRNAAVMPKPLSSTEAVELVQSFRSNRFWSLSKGTEDVAEQVWRSAAVPDFPRRAIFDARIAYSLAAFGVKRFATRNTGDFVRFGVFEAFDPTLTD